MVLVSQSFQRFRLVLLAMSGLGEVRLPGLGLFRWQIFHEISRSFFSEVSFFCKVVFLFSPYFCLARVLVRRDLFCSLLKFSLCVKFIQDGFGVVIGQLVGVP